MINKVILTGRNTRDINLLQTKNGTAFAYFTLAVNKNTSNREGQVKEADFIPCIAWRKNAEFLKKYITKGMLIAVEGSLDVYNNKDENGKYETRVNVVVSQIHFLESKNNKMNNYSELNDSNSSNNFNDNESSNPKESEEEFENINFENIEF